MVTPEQSAEKDVREHVVVGAIWRRKKTGALVRIAGLTNHASDWNPQPYYDISWETVEKPIRRGQSYQDYWFKNCEPVTPAETRCPTCIHPEGYDRLSGPCPTCHGDGAIPTEGSSDD